MPVPNIIADGISADVAELDANFAYLAALRDLFTISAGKAGLGGSPVSTWHLFSSDANVTTITRSANVLSIGAASVSMEMGCLSGTTPTSALGISATLDGAGTGGTFSVFTRTGGTLTEKLRIDSSAAVRPGGDNTQNSGTASSRWAVVYAGTGTINTSDAREKTAVRGLSSAEVNAAKALAAEIGAYKFLGAIAEKGEANARWHCGMTVQRAIEVMTAHELDPFAYGFICFDEWEASAEEGTPAGDRYAFRPDELLLFIAAGFNARLASLEAA